MQIGDTYEYKNVVTKEITAGALGSGGLDIFATPFLICWMEAAAYYAQKGMNLGDAIDSLYETFGYYRNDLCSFTFEGVSGMQTMKNLMERLRAEKPAELAGRKVLSSVDYENDDTGLPKAQVLEYRLEGKAKLIVRPSGTEPKIKVYLSAVGKTREEADSVIETMKRTANELMKA